jgi:MFS family permease
MADIGTGASKGNWVREITGYQWLVLFVAWAGWSLDITDFTLYGLVLRQAMTELLGGNPSLAEIGRVGGLITTIGLLGWAFGGFIFGIIADYIGRVRTLALSILIYSVFTALQGFAQDAWQLGLYRFIAGLGTGAELMIAIPLVAEAFAETQRAKILGFMMTGGGFGTLFGAAIYGWVGNYGLKLDFPLITVVEGAPYAWRTVFFMGIFPALLLAFIRRGMVEPERFAAVKARRQALATTRERTEEDRQFLAFVPLQLFSRGIRFQTLVGVLFALGTLLAVWTAAAWLPTIQHLLLQKQGIAAEGARIPYVRNGMMLWGIGGIFGYIVFGYVADLIGRRPTIFVYTVGTLIFGLVLFLVVDSYDPYPILLPIYGFFVIGIFSGHAIYMSELFPTQVRSTAVAFCNGSGRVITSFGPLAAGLLVVQLGGLTNATGIMTGFAVLSVVAIILGRETRDEQLPR